MKIDAIARGFLYIYVDCIGKRRHEERGGVRKIDVASKKREHDATLAMHNKALIWMCRRLLTFPSVSGMICYTCISSRADVFPPARPSLNDTCASQKQVAEAIVSSRNESFDE